MGCCSVSLLPYLRILVPHTLTTVSNSGIKGQKDMVRGQRLYVAGDGIGHPKDGMPVHVRLRQK